VRPLSISRILDNLVLAFFKMSILERAKWLDMCQRCVDSTLSNNKKYSTASILPYSEVYDSESEYDVVKQYSCADCMPPVASQLTALFGTVSVFHMW
jgi:hypothetical protein